MLSTAHALYDFVQCLKIGNLLSPIFDNRTIKHNAEHMHSFFDDMLGHLIRDNRPNLKRGAGKNQGWGGRLSFAEGTAEPKKLTLQDEGPMSWGPFSGRDGIAL